MMRYEQLDRGVIASHELAIVESFNRSDVTTTGHPMGTYIKPVADMVVLKPTTSRHES